MTRALTLWAVPAVVAARQAHAHRHAAPASFPGVYGYGITVAIVIGLLALIRALRSSRRPTPQGQSKSSST